MSKTRSPMLLAMALIAFGWSVAISLAATFGFAAAVAQAADADPADTVQADRRQAEAVQPDAQRPEPADNPAPPPPERLADRRERVGQLIVVNQPITDRVENRLRRAVTDTIKKAKETGQWPVLIFELRPGDSEFGKALDLARYLRGPNLDGATTVAYLPETITGHGVLVAMACEEIIMSEDAQIGEAGRTEDGVTPLILNAYVDIADKRRTIPADVARKMLDKSIELRVVETDVSREFVRADRLEELKRHRKIAKSDVLIAAGKPGLFTGQQARDLGFASFLANDRAAVAKALGLPASAVQDDLSLLGALEPVRIDIKGPISASAADQVQTLVEKQIRDHDANLICLWIDSAGGSPSESINLANYLKSLDSAQRRTVAYIPREARGDAAFLALACDQIVMRPGAVLGGSGNDPMEDDERQATAVSVAELATDKHRSPSLAAAMVDPRNVVFRYKRKSDGLVDYFSEDEAAKLKDAPQWQREQAVTNDNTRFQVKGEEALEFGLADAVVDDFEGLKALYGLQDDVKLAEPNWADFLIDALNSPGVSIFLLLLGFAALYAELQSPGIGLGGLIAALCFLLYFWSAYLGGTAGWLEVLLFLAGVTCLALEVFVLPGFGIFGLFGGLMIIGSLILASQTFVLPRNDYQLHQLRNSLLVLTGAGIGTVVAAMLMRRYLPHAPMFNHMVLTPPTDEELSRITEREALAQLDHLLGSRGTSFTPLVPGGKARFGDQLVDVLTDGEFIDRGCPVEVVEVRGHRVVVRGLS
ncbi:MAG TPA: NfeD family protein [Pirellulales bacterium]|nr:NfeD family protein [Pirellulales bacterium]